MPMANTCATYRGRVRGDVVGACQGECVSGRKPRPGYLGHWRFHPGHAQVMKRKTLSHYDAAGRVSMVDVSHKEATERTATAHAFVAMKSEVIEALPDNKKRRNPLEVARIAGISAAKKTSDLIPLCHQIPLTHAAVDFSLEEAGISITATVATTARTGVEMEALTAVSVAALTIYDMTKALDKSIEIREVYLMEKTGGKSGTYLRKHAGK